MRKPSFALASRGHNCLVEWEKISFAGGLVVFRGDKGDVGTGPAKSRPKGECSFRMTVTPKGRVLLLPGYQLAGRMLLVRVPKEGGHRWVQSTAFSRDSPAELPRSDDPSQRDATQCFSVGGQLFPGGAAKLQRDDGCGQWKAIGAFVGAMLIQGGASC